jgi:putative transposase
MLNIVHDAAGAVADDPEVTSVGLDELCRVAAQQMLATALLAERRAYLEAHADELDATGCRLVVGNGYACEREVVTGAGPVSVKAPRVDDRRDGHRYSSRILPAYMRRSPKVTEVLPILYLRGLSTGDFAPALGEFFGSDAGLSPSTIQRLTETWQTEHTDWCTRDLSDRDYVYWWVDGVHFNVRLEEDRLCCLVIVGVRPDGTKEVVTVTDGFREDTESWADLLRDLRDRGLGARWSRSVTGRSGSGLPCATCSPTPGSNVAGFTRPPTVWPPCPNASTARPRRRWRRSTTQSPAPHALTAATEFADTFADHPKAVAKITGDLDVLLTFYDYPAEHWIHLRTTNPIESTFSTVRLGTRATRGAGSRKAALAMAYKLLDAAQARWRRINAPELVPLVRAGATFIDGHLQERSDTTDPDTGSVAA